MRWPWQKSENRQGYADALLDQLYAAAEGRVDANPLFGAALETSAGLWSRAFAMASGGEPYFDPTNLSWIARQLCRHGECVALIEPGEPLRPAVLVLVEGGADESDWRYRLELVGPSFTSERTVRAHQVAHFRYAFASSAPWRGISPLQYAKTTGKLAGGLERALTEEAGATVGYVLPVPAQEAGSDDDSDPLAKLRATLKDLQGRIAMVTSTAGGWSEGRVASPPSEWTPRRLGASPPDALVKLRYQAVASILSATGVSPVLAGLSESGGSQNALREALRQFLHSTVAPVARIVAAEAERKLGRPVAFDFDALFASDVQGRARAFQSMVGGGMPLERAASLSGLLAVDPDD